MKGKLIAFHLNSLCSIFAGRSSMKMRPTMTMTSGKPSAQIGGRLKWTMTPRRLLIGGLWFRGSEPHFVGRNRRFWAPFGRLRMWNLRHWKRGPKLWLPVSLAAIHRPEVIHLSHHFWIWDTQLIPHNFLVWPLLDIFITVTRAEKQGTINCQWFEDHHYYHHWLHRRWPRKEKKVAVMTTPDVPNIWDQISIGFAWNEAPKFGDTLTGWSPKAWIPRPLIQIYRAISYYYDISPG